METKPNRETKYFLLRQEERYHPLCRDVYLTIHYTETDYFSQAHAFSISELLNVPDKLQDKFVVVPEAKLLAEVQMLNEPPEPKITYNRLRVG